MSSNVRELITGIGGFEFNGEGPSSAYSATVGRLAGDDVMYASVLAFCDESAPNQGLWGNSAGTDGWGLRINGGIIEAFYGDGAALVIAAAPASYEPYRWMLIEMTLVNSGTDLALYVNGKLMDFVAGANPIQPAVGSAVVGILGGVASSNNLIAGVAYGTTVPSSLELQQHWEAVRRSGQIGIVPLVSTSYVYDNAWQVAFYNDGGHPPVFVGTLGPEPAASWPPVVGTLALTKVGSQLVVLQMTSEWVSMEGGSGITPNFNALPPQYMEGYNLQNDSEVASVIRKGAARDTTNTANIIANVDLANDLSTPGAGGLDTGTVADDTWYAIYVIGDGVSGGVVNTVASLSFTTPLLPPGFTVYRRIGDVYVVNNDGSVLRPWEQFGNGIDREYVWNTPVNVLAAGVATIPTAVLGAAAAPQGVAPFGPTRTKLRLNAELTGTTAGVGTISGTVGQTALRISASGEFSTCQLEVDAASNAAFEYVNSVNTVNLTLDVYGWRESL